jgi:hypothetical protein
MPTNVTEKRIRLGGGNVEFEGTIAATKGGEAVSNTAQEVCTRHLHAPLWLYATPAHALRDTYHASNYLTIAEGPERIGSMVGSRLAT